MHRSFFIAIKIILTAIIFSACSKSEDLSTPEKVYINVLFTPESFCNIGYNDITLKAVETYSQIYGYEYSFCVPESIEEGMDYYQNWCEATLNDDIARSLFVFASSLYEEPLAKAPHPTADSHKDILIFEVNKELPYAYTFDIVYYGAAYMVGSYLTKSLPIDFQIIAANPYLEGLSDIVDGLTDATLDGLGGSVNTYYISESPNGGLDDDDGAYLGCKSMYTLNPDGINMFIPYAGLSNLGVYRFSQSTHQPVVGIDCIDPNSFSHIDLSMNKKMDLALDDFLQLWIKGKEIPRHTLYTLESGRVTVDRHSILDVDSEILDQLFEQAIAKEKEYYQKQEVDESDL
jgi:hypothetical protein